MKKISIQNNVWQLVSNGEKVLLKKDLSLEVVIVGAAEHISRIYYAGAYKKDNYNGPDCYSTDGAQPHSLAKTPQAKICANCTQNIKGSGVGMSRACRFQQRIAVVLGDDIGGDVYQLNIPSKSIFGEGSPKKWPLQAYSKRISSMGAPIMSVVTEMYLRVSDTTTQITFQPVRILDKDEFDIAIKQAESTLVKKAVNVTFKTSFDKPDLDILNKSNFNNLVNAMGMTADI